jgi:hypothetical protein
MQNLEIRSLHLSSEKKQSDIDPRKGTGQEASFLQELPLLHSVNTSRSDFLSKLSHRALDPEYSKGTKLARILVPMWTNDERAPFEGHHIL